MPVIFVKGEFHLLNSENIKCDVIYFSKSLFLLLFLSYNQGDHHPRTQRPLNIFWVQISPLSISKGIILNNLAGIRFYSTGPSICPSISNLDKSAPDKNKGRRKTLSSPESKPYADLYKGRGVPKYEPAWVKDNQKERSPFGASWAKDEKDRLSLPAKYPLNYRNIADPYNNRDAIKEICKGNRVVYIWTYLRTGICLVGSSSNSVERVLSYFEKKYLFLDMRRGVQFLADYGFKDIQLTILYYDYLKFTARDIKIIEAYFINELNSSLNSQKFVYLPPEPLEDVLPFINITNRDTAVPIFVYGVDNLTRVLYVFNSKTSIYNDFNIHWTTLDKYLDNLDKKYFNYFVFSTKVLEGSDFDSLLSLNELNDLKSRKDPQIPSRKQLVKLTDLVKNEYFEFYSLSRAAGFIADTVGSCDRGVLRTHMKNGTIYKKRWMLEKL